MAAAVNRGLVFCFDNSPAFLSGVSNLPFPFSSVSTSRFCSSSSYTQLRALTFYGRSRTLPPITHITPTLAVGPDPQTSTSQSKDDQDDVLEQLGIQRLVNKEKKELRAYAHGIGTKLTTVQHVIPNRFRRDFSSSISTIFKA